MQRSWLWVLLGLFWVRLHLWWLSWVEASISFFDSVTDINTDKFATFGNCDSTWPLKGLKDVDGVGNSSITFIILLWITGYLGSPSEFKALDWSILLDGAETLFDFVFVGEFGHVIFLVSL